MAAFNIAALADPQFVSDSITPIPFIIFQYNGSPATTPPSGSSFLLQSAYAANQTTAPIGLTVWVVPSGVAFSESLPASIPKIYVAIPANYPGGACPLYPLWGLCLQAGDKLVALADTANAISFSASGAIIG